MWKKKKKLSHVMLELQNMRMESSNVRKSKKTTKCEEKKMSHVILELHNVRMKPLMWKKKSKGTIKCKKRTVTYDVETA